MFISLHFLLLCPATAQTSNPFDIPPSETEGRTDMMAAPQTHYDFERDSIDLDTTVDTIGALASSEVNPFDIKKNSPNVRDPKGSPESRIANGSPLRRLQSKDTNLLSLVYSLVMLIIITLAVSIDRKRFLSIMISPINTNKLRGLYRDHAHWTNGQAVILNLCFVLNATFLIWIFDLKIDGFARVHLFWIFGAVLGCYLIRHFTMWMISSIYPVGPEVMLHSYSISVHNIVLGVLILPLIAAVEFVPGIPVLTYVYASIGVFFLVYILRQVKGLFLAGSMRGFSPFYFFIYLCAVEIAPILVAYRMTIGAL